MTTVQRVWTGTANQGGGAEAWPRRTVIFGAFQDGGRAGDPVPNAGEGQHLELVEHELAQARQQRRLRVVPAHHAAPGLGVQVFGPEQDLSSDTEGQGGEGRRCEERPGGSGPPGKDQGPPPGRPEEGVGI